MSASEWNRDQSIGEAAQRKWEQERGGKIADALARLIEADPHQWSARPCQTCRAASALLDRPFGCSARAK